MLACLPQVVEYRVSIGSVVGDGVMCGGSGHVWASPKLFAKAKSAENEEGMRAMRGVQGSSKIWGRPAEPEGCVACRDEIFEKIGNGNRQPVLLDVYDFRLHGDLEEIVGAAP